VETNILDNLGNFGDFIGGIGVVATLIYLAIQIRQNTTALKTASRQDVTNGFRDWNRLVIDTKNMDAFTAGIRRYPNVLQAQMWTFSTMLNDQCHHLESAFALYEAGTLDDETYGTYLGFFCSTVATPGGKAWWEEIGPMHVAPLVAEVDALLLKGGLPNLLDSPVFAEQPSVDSAA